MKKYIILTMLVLTTKANALTYASTAPLLATAPIQLEIQNISNKTIKIKMVGIDKKFQSIRPKKYFKRKVQLDQLLQIVYPGADKDLISFVKTDRNFITTVGRKAVLSLTYTYVPGSATMTAHHQLMGKHIYTTQPAGPEVRPAIPGTTITVGRRPIAPPEYPREQLPWLEERAPSQPYSPSQAIG